MNKCIFMGRLTKDPEIRSTTGSNPITIASFSLAVDKRSKEKATDFLPVKAFGKQAEFAEKYLSKGMKVLVTARAQQESYEKDGKVNSYIDFIADEIEFTESKGKKEDAPKEEFVPVQSDDDELPFSFN